MQVWDLAEFRVGLWIGAGAGALALVIVALGASYRARLAAIGGIFLSAAALIAVAAAVEVPAIVPIAMAGMAGCAAIVHALHYDPALAMVGAAPFGWLLGWHSGVVDIAWVRFLVGATAVVGGYLVGRLDDDWRADAVSTPMLLVSLAGVYYTVPDTEASAAVLGVAVVFGLLGWPLRRLVLGRTGSAAVLCLVPWCIAIDSRARLSSIIAGVMCLGLLVAVPAGAVIAPRVVQRAGSATSIVLGMLAVHTLLVLVAAKYGGDDGDAHRAMGIGIGFGLASLAAGVGFRAPQRPAAQPAPSVVAVQPAQHRWSFNAETNRWVRAGFSEGSGSR